MSIDTITISRIGGVGSARIGATLGWQKNTVGLHMVLTSVGPLRAACDIHDIIVAAQHQIVAKEEILNEAVRLD